MYNRRSSSTGSRLSAGIIIVIGSVFIFSAITSRQSSPQFPTSAPTTTALPATATPSPVPVQPKTISYRIVAEKAHLVADITDVYFDRQGNWNVDDLGLYAGHLEGTAELGHSGNYVLAGHVELKDGRPGPFALLGSLSPGDPISIFVKDNGKVQIKRYTVSQVIKVAPDSLGEVRDHGYEELTLLTCSDYSAQTNTYNTRLVVHARLSSG